MEELIKNLKKQGWSLSEEKLEAIFHEDETGGRNQFVKDPERWLLDQDMKTFGLPSLPDGINSGKISQLSCPIVLQIKKVDTISAPQSNVESQAAPRMLKVGLSDGKTVCYGIEFDHVPKLSAKTPPGTKVRLINSVKLTHGFLLLDAKNVQILGGEVPHLVDEWRIQQSLIGYVRATNLENGPPPWVPFGQKVKADHIVEKAPASKEVVEEKEEKDDEFFSQRQDAIAAAVQTGQKKVFKSSGKQMEISQPERRGGRGRGEGRRGRDREPRDDFGSSRPPDSIRLFEFLPSQIGTEDVPDVEDYGDQGSFGTRDRNFGPSRGSHRRSGRTSFGDRQRSYGDEGSYRDRGRSAGRGRRSRGAPYRDGPDDRHYSNPTNPIATLVDDFASWPGLGSRPDPAAQQSSHEKSSPSWNVNDYCLAQWDLNKFYPAIIQELSNLSATVVFVETGAVRRLNVDQLQRDPGDSRPIRGGPSSSNSGRRGHFSTRPTGRIRY